MKSRQDSPSPLSAVEVDEELAALDAITDEEAEKAARNDPDNPPITEEEWAAALAREAERDIYGVARLRRRLRISQFAFAERYGLPVGTLRQWEQGLREPDAAAKSLLAVIEADPEFAAEAIRRRAA